MSVFRKKRINGSLSENWYYEFKIGEQRYRGSTFRSSKKAANDFENNLKFELRSLVKGNVADKVKKKNLMEFCEKISNEIQGDSIKLEDIWETFKKDAPAKMRRIPSEKGWIEKESYLKDFLYFLKTQHPNCQTMRDVTAAMAESYIGIIKTSGRVCKTIRSKGVTYENKTTLLSASSINEYIIQLNQIFRILSSSAGLLENPFEQIEKAPKKSKKRDVFAMHELEKIDSFLKETNLAASEFEKSALLINEAIFVIGINTGLRKGDICRLRWSDVDFTKTSIEMELSKTGENVFIPLTGLLYNFLKEKEKYKINEYVTPELAKMYKENAEGISYRFKKMLAHLEIESLKAHLGRSRKTSNKDIHSLRHTFCYLHGMRGTRLIVLQSMVGHLDKKMTESYMMHQTEELKREAIKKFSLNPFQAVSLDPLEKKKKELYEMIKDCESEETLEDITTSFQNLLKLIQRGVLEGGSSLRM